MSRLLRNYSTLDKLVILIDRTIKSLTASHNTKTPNYPADGLAEPNLSTKERRHIAGLMRVNHSGEVCAQALYHGQATSAQLTHVRDKMLEAAKEEEAHLAWCARRLHELGHTSSYLDPIWYAGSFTLGLLAGLAGDRLSLGFVAETERQVTQHLTKHLQRLPHADHKSRAIIEQMRIDEDKHATTALQAGAVELPWPIPTLMQLASKIMTTSSYRF